jgi:hypothetical protein
MPLDAARAQTLTEAIKAAFDAIGTEGRTSMPPSSSNTDPIAWEYHVASLLLRYAEKRRERATKAAVKAGVLFDHTESPLPIGTERDIYEGKVLAIGVSVVEPQVKFDDEAFVLDLAKAGVKPAVLKRLRHKHTHPFKPIHRFSSRLLAG